MTTILSIASSASIVIVCAHHQEIKMTTIFVSVVSGVIASHSSFEWIMSTARYLLLMISWHAGDERTRMQSQPQSQHKRKNNNTRIKVKDFRVLSLPWISMSFFFSSVAS